MGSSLVFDFTHISGHTNDNVGLDLEITPVALGENNIELNLTGQLHLKAEDGSTIASQEINANYLFQIKALYSWWAFFRDNPFARKIYMDFLTRRLPFSSRCNSLMV